MARRASGGAFSGSDGHIYAVTARGSAVTTAVQRQRPTGRGLQPAGESQRVHFAGASGDWLSLGGETLYDSRTAEWSPFVLFATAAAAADEARQLGIGRLGRDGSWRGFEVVQEFPALGAAAGCGDVEVWLGDGPVVCVHDVGAGRLVVLCPAVTTGVEAVGAAWESCLVALPQQGVTAEAGSAAAAAAAPRGCALLYCGPQQPGAAGAARGAPSVLLTESTGQGERLRWLTVDRAAGCGLALAAAARPPVLLAPSYCSARPRSVCWAADRTRAAPVPAAVAAVCFVGLEDGRLLKLDMGAGDPRLLGSRELSAAEPVLHLRSAVLGRRGGGGGQDVVIAQQWSAVHILAVGSLEVLKSIAAVSPTAASSSTGAEAALRYSVLVDRFSAGSAGAVDELLLLDYPPEVAVGGSGRRLGDGRGEWRVSSAASLALRASACSEAGGAAQLVARHGLGWQDDCTSDESGSQASSAGSQLTPVDASGSSAQENDGVEAKAITAFTASLQSRLQAAQQSLHQQERTLVDKRSLLRYTQRLLVEMAAGAAAGANGAAPAAQANDLMARGGLRQLLGGADDDDAGARQQAAEMSAAGFVPPAFAGLVVPRAAVRHGEVCVVSVAQQTVAAGAGSGAIGGASGAMDLCLTVGVQNTGETPVRDLSVAVLPWRSDSASASSAGGLALPPPLPSVATALQSLSGGGESGALQVVVGVPALLGLEDPSAGGGASSPSGSIGQGRRVVIGAPPQQNGGHAVVSLYLLLTWQQHGSSAAGGIVHGPITLDVAQLLQPHSHGLAEPQSKRWRGERGAATAIYPINAAVAARHVSLEHVSILLLAESSSAADGGSDGGTIDVQQLGSVLAAQSGLHQTWVAAAEGAGTGGLLLRPPTEAEMQGAAGGGGLSGVSSAFLSAHSGQMDSTKNGNEAAAEVEEGEGVEKAAAAAWLERGARHSGLVSCQLWCKPSATPLVLHQLALLLPDGVSMLPPVAMLPPPGVAADMPVAHPPSVLRAQEDLVDALEDELSTVRERWEPGQHDVSAADAAAAMSGDGWAQIKAGRHAAMRSDLAAAKLLAAAETVWPN